ncbi:MAG TPA: TolC family protein [Pirellulaceae bacterium]|nr:TolC family protein [Pirellulaceae bacterium]
MTRQRRTQLALLLVALTVFTGCHPTQPFYLQEDGDLSHYIDHAVSLSNPDVYEPSLDEVIYARAPHTLSHPGEPAFWDLSLEEAISIAMKNSKVIRNLGGVTQIGFADALVGRTGNASIYDVALSETAASGQNPAAVGARGENATTGSALGRYTAQQAGGPESALAAFDTQLRIASNLGGGFFNKTDRPQNTGVNPIFPNVSEGDTGGVRMDLSKRTASGATFSVASITGYDGTNRFGNTQALNSFWTQALEIEAHQPLLRGAGTLINRIPVVLARMNTDISAANFEGSVRNMVLDIENSYWDLYVAYRAVQTAKIGRNSAQVTWHITNEKKIGGKEDVQHEAQAREQYFFFLAALQQAMQQLYEVESRLRFLMGIAATDGRTIRPSDDPTAARVEFDWAAIHTEAIVRSPELRSQKWALKQRELELMSAKNQLLPVLDVGVVYRWLGLGDELINADRNGINFPNAGSTAVDELFEGKYQEVGFFLNFGMPVGFRQEMNHVRNAQLQLARAKAVLEDMELNTSHLLSSAIRNLDFQYEQAQSHFNRWQASQLEVEATEALRAAGTIPLDIALEAQRRRAQGQIDFHRALGDYNKALAEVHYRKASLLEYNNIYLAEGSWPEKAYYDALGHARERDASYYMDYGWTRPGVVSQGSVQQGTDEINGVKMLPAEELGPYETEELGPYESLPTEAAPAEQVPAGQPVLADPPTREIVPLSEPLRSGPVSTRPERPESNDPRRAELPAIPAYNWGTLGLNYPGIDVSPESNVLRQASFEQPQ